MFGLMTSVCRKNSIVEPVKIIIYRAINRFLNHVNLLWVLSFRTAIPNAFLLPTRITNLFPLVIAVYSRFLCNKI